MSKKTKANPKDLQIVSETLKVLSNKNRLEILCLLESGEFSVNELAEAIHMGQSALSQQLKILKDAEILTTRRDHNKIYYQFQNDNIKQIITLLRTLYCKAD